MLDGFKNVFGIETVGLYRDDCLAVLPNSTCFKVKRLKKQTHAIFKSMGLRVTNHDKWLLRCEANLEELFYMPYIIQNLKIIYINEYYIHPNKNIKLYQV